MTNIEIIKSTTLLLTVNEIRIMLDDGNYYEITDNDRIYFTVKKQTRSRETVIRKKYPGTIELIDGSLLIKILPDDTDTLDCVSYDYDCKIDLSGEGRDIYTLIAGKFTINSSVTLLKDMV